LASTEHTLPTIDLGLPGWCLRAWRAGDAPSLSNHASNRNITRWMSDGFPHDYTLAIAEQWVTRGHIDFGGDNWAVAHDDEAVGGCGIHPQGGPLRCNAEVGWWLSEAHWGRGVGSRIARTLVARAFEDPLITRVFAPVHAGNERSMATARSAGMQLEGVQRKSAIKDGAFIDRHIYAIVRDQ
jgi:RimJ/RimL family protein N-acetyltransferase